MPFDRFDGAGNDLYNWYGESEKKYFTGRVLTDKKGKKRIQNRIDSYLPKN